VGEHAEIVLGPARESLLRAERVRRALGRFSLESLFGLAPDPQASLDERVDALLVDPDHAIKTSSFNWFVTIIIQRTTAVANDALLDHRYFWLDPEEAGRLEEEFGSRAFPEIDLLAVYVSTVVDLQMFERVIVDDVVYFSSPGRETFGLSRGSSSAELSVDHPMESLDIGELNRLLTAIRAAPRQRPKWLADVANWYLSAAREEDQLKRFLWYFFGLEILTQKLAPELYGAVTTDLGIKLDDGTYQEGGDLPIAQLLGERGRLTLVSKFTIIAMKLLPTDATADVQQFKDLKAARDAFAHGDLSQVNNLTTHRARTLLGRYIAAALRFKFPTQAVPSS
jgi:hypothetical protein